MFYSSYQYEKKYDKTEDGRITNVELVIEDVEFKSNLVSSEYSNYHEDVTAFYQKYSLIPNTGLKLYYWSDVSDSEDDDWERAEKMTTKLLYESGQEFVNTKKIKQKD